MLPDFKNKSLLITALSHRSSLNERSSGTTATESNERLEFLGDAVLEMVVTKYLFNLFPQEPEGRLTAYRSALVKTETLAQVAAELGLQQQLFMSKGEEATGGRTNQGLLADVFEAVVGALYLDQGLEVAETFLQQVLFPRLSAILEDHTYKDAKSSLQEVVQGQGSPTPTYLLVKEEGPDHQKIFTVQVMVNGEIKGIGLGKSKQIAQQEAARTALEKMSISV